MVVVWQGCFDRDYYRPNQWLYLDSSITGGDAQMSNPNDCNMELNLDGQEGRCICQTCAPGKYKAKLICKDDLTECILEKDRTKKYYTEIYQCRRCEVGTYQNEIGQNQCKICDKGQYQDIPFSNFLETPTLDCKYVFHFCLRFFVGCSFFSDFYLQVKCVQMDIYPKHP